MNEITYKREMNHSYMVIRMGQEIDGSGYVYRMILQNRIGRLLDCSRRQLDGETYLYYDISSRQPLERLYESVKIGVDKLRQVLEAIAAMQEDLGEYLLDGQGLLLEGGTIFADVETEELFFCYYPGRYEGLNRYAALADFFLERVDHGEEHAVNIAYQFYKMSKSDFFVLSAFLPFLEKEAAAYQKERGEQPDLRWKALEEDSRRLPAWTEDAKTAGQWEKREAFGNAFPEEEPENTGKKQKVGRRSSPKRKKEKEDGEKKRSGLLQRLIRRRKPDKPEKEQYRQEWPDSVWNSYESQFNRAQNGETVYFADLEKLRPAKRGVRCLTGEDGERRFLLQDLPLTVGKLKGKVSIVLEDSSVSRMHARLEDAEEGILLRDLNSRNGTLVNGRKLLPNEAVLLSEGDLVQFGRERFQYGFLDSKALK